MLLVLFLDFISLVTGTGFSDRLRTFPVSAFSCGGIYGRQTME